MPPKYQLIADELRIHIEAGKYSGKDTLPTEFAIAEEYQVSRQTVRQALAVLVRDGIIESARAPAAASCAAPPPRRARSTAPWRS